MHYDTFRQCSLSHNFDFIVYTNLLPPTPYIPECHPKTLQTPRERIVDRKEFGLSPFQRLGFGHISTDSLLSGLYCMVYYGKW